MNLPKPHHGRDKGNDYDALDPVKEENHHPPKKIHKKKHKGGKVEFILLEIASYYYILMPKEKNCQKEKKNIEKRVGRNNSSSFKHQIIFMFGHIAGCFLLCF